MANKRPDAQFTELFERATPPLPPHLKARAIEEMRAAAEHVAQPKPMTWFLRRRLVTAAIGVCIMLFVLGFVPLPTGGSNRLMVKVVAALKQATAVHMTYTDKAGNLISETWLSEDGFRRKELYQDGKLVTLIIEEETTYTWFDGNSNTANYYDLPPSPQHAGKENLSNYVNNLLESLQNSKCFKNMRTANRVTRTLWGGTTNVIEVAGIITQDTYMGPMRYFPRERIRVEITLNSSEPNRALLKYHRLSDTEEEFDYQECIVEWNLAVPDEVKAFSPPAGAKVIKLQSWAGRVDKLIKTAETPDWKVFLHALDIEANGNIYVTVSRERKYTNTNPSKYPEGTFPRVQAVDNAGKSYMPGEMSAMREHLLLHLVPQYSGSMVRPSSMNLTIYPYPAGVCMDQFVFFENISISVRQQPLESTK